MAIDPVAAKVPSSVGDHGWGGAASTAYWVDPALDLVVLFMTQLLPSDSLPIRSRLRTLVHSRDHGVTRTTRVEVLPAASVHVAVIVNEGPQRIVRSPMRSGPSGVG